jgi:hypothetical protein
MELAAFFVGSPDSRKVSQSPEERGAHALSRTECDGMPPSEMLQSGFYRASLEKKSIFSHSRPATACVVNFCGNPGLILSGFRVKPGMTRPKSCTNLFETAL